MRRPPRFLAPSIPLVLPSIIAVCAVATDRAAADLLFFPHLEMYGPVLTESKVVEADDPDTVQWISFDPAWYDVQLRDVVMAEDFGIESGHDSGVDVSRLIFEYRMEAQKRVGVFSDFDRWLAFSGRDGREEYDELDGDGLIVDRTVYLNSPEIAFGGLVTEDELREPGLINGGGRRRGSSGWSTGVNVGMMGKVVVAPGRHGGLRGTMGTPLAEMYYLDWPWSTRVGRNMFFWVIGPPAFVFLTVLGMAVFSRASRY